MATAPTASRFERLLGVARDNNVQVHSVDPGAAPGINWDGLYLVTPELGAGIAIRGDLPPEWRDWILAHELGHHFGKLNGGLFSPFQPYTMAALVRSTSRKCRDPDEDFANEWAARDLISGEMWDNCERQTPCDLAAIVGGLDLPLPAGIAWERWQRRTLQGDAIQVKVTGELRAVLRCTIFGNGGHQSFLRRLTETYKRNTVTLTYQDFSQARERAATARGGWRTPYQALMDATKPLLRRSGNSRLLFNLSERDA